MGQGGRVGGWGGRRLSADKGGKNSWRQQRRSRKHFPQSQRTQEKYITPVEIAGAHLARVCGSVCGGGAFDLWVELWGAWRAVARLHCRRAPVHSRSVCPFRGCPSRSWYRMCSSLNTERTGSQVVLRCIRYARGRGAVQSSVTMHPSTRPVSRLSATTDKGWGACAARSTKGMMSECQWWRLRFRAKVKGSAWEAMVSAMQATAASDSSGVRGVKVRAEAAAALKARAEKRQEERAAAAPEAKERKKGGIMVGGGGVEVVSGE